MNSKYKIKNIKNLHRGFFSLKEINFTHKKHNGDWTPIIKREIFGGAHVSAVLPYDPLKKKNSFIKAISSWHNKKES